MTKVEETEVEGVTPFDAIGQSDDEPPKVELMAHPYANLFPMMTEGGIAKLAEDIKKNGLLDPIVIHNGFILDGRNRYAACVIAGCEPVVVPFTPAMFNGEDDPLGFVISKNMERRHLTPAQRAMIGVALVTKKGFGPKKKGEVTAAEVAGVVGVHASSIHDAVLVKKNASEELVEAVKGGKLSLKKAKHLTSTLTPNEQTSAILDGVMESFSGVAKAAGGTSEAMGKVGQLAGAPQPWTLKEWDELTILEQDSLITKAIKSEIGILSPTNGPNGQWQQWTWNPITGCAFGCTYCTARVYAEKFYKTKFNLALWLSRLGAPLGVDPPTEAETDQAKRSILLGDMGDMWNALVPANWIDAVLEVVAQSQEWEFYTLTKNPARYREHIIPKNLHVGVTVTSQPEVFSAEKWLAAAKADHKWIACEPLLSALQFEDLSPFEFMVIGGCDKTPNIPAWQPPMDWMVRLHNQAAGYGLPIRYKPSAGLWGGALKPYNPFAVDPTPPSALLHY